MPEKSDSPFPFWQELRRRRVIRVIIVYAAAGFAIIEFVDIVTEPLNLPEWALVLVIILVAVGFPFAIIFAWIFDITAKGIKKTEPLGASTEENEAHLTRVKQVIPENSIIVLPFENISPDPDQEYFSDGITEEIITDLSHIHDLMVISRSSAMTFKGSKNTIKEIAEKVNVRYVLEGSVRKAGNNLRITAQLIDGMTDSHLWAEKYTGTLDDIFDIQEKVARSIVDSVGLKLSSIEDRRISERPIDSIPAYEVYLRATAAFIRGTEDAMYDAIRYFQLAIDTMGDNILLYSGMAYTYFLLMNIGINIDENRAKVEEYARKALVPCPESFVIEFGNLFYAA